MKKKIIFTKYSALRALRQSIGDVLDLDALELTREERSVLAEVEAALDIKEVRQEMKSRPLSAIGKEKQKDNDKVIGKNPAQFKKFVREQAEAQPGNEFWQSMKQKMEDGALTERMVEAIRKSMDKAQAKQENKPLMENVEIEIPSWLARDREIGKSLTGNVMYESAKAYYFKGTTVVRPSDTCLRCARPLTHPISLMVGYGAECCEKIGVAWNADESQIEEFKKAIASRTFEGWLPKSKVKVVSQ